jgi:hypothetical protein
MIFFLILYNILSCVGILMPIWKFINLKLKNIFFAHFGDIINVIKNCKNKKM